MNDPNIAHEKQFIHTSLIPFIHIITDRFRQSFAFVETPMNDLKAA